MPELPYFLAVVPTVLIVGGLALLLLVMAWLALVAVFGFAITGGLRAWLRRRTRSGAGAVDSE
ncbi:hypothetical protein LX16_3858 [Stackebrandtia albiflava]|uniref:Uncharacterized protein n=1 Tax=Stackebrandtia albiflava TaxID=406432 RepID=A0A562UXT2_9ACTN|nr:hypothetical protein [Stackebrandtia albiflava]TWJ10441.1 hypothetical protein LX16_3858 [Stackebrandtia albiflava]